MSGPLRPFVFPTLPATWFIGHMSRALREIQQMVQGQQVDLVIETRDARMPLTSMNPAFEHMLKAATGGHSEGFTKRLIVYNKADLAQESFQEPLRKALWKTGQQEVIFTDSTADSEVKRLLQAAIRLADRPLDSPTDRLSVLIAGMPNVGKSSILNSLRRVGVRKGKAASTSSMPGHTRKLSTVIKISEKPPVYIFDTPGIMVPYLGGGVAGKEAALKLALTGGIKESLFEWDTVSEYLLWRLRSRCWAREDGYTEADLLKSLALPPDTPLDPPHVFYEALAKRLSAVQKGGIPDLDFAGRWLLHAFREGRLGRWTLDSLGRGGEAADYALARERAFDAAQRNSSVLLPEDYAVYVPEQPRAPEGGIVRSAEELEVMVAREVERHAFEAAGAGREGMSGHQKKKEVKAAQAAEREVKRKSKAVASVQGRPGRGNAIASARRRNYRR